MKKAVVITTGLLILSTAAWTVLYLQSGAGTAFTLAVTFGTISYHFSMRLAVGAGINAWMRNKADYTRSWYRPRKWEEKLYQVLRVKKWKGKLPTFSPEAFDFEKKSLEEIAQAMCQSEVVHEVIFVLNFLPIFASVWFGALPVFVITSILASILELACIAAQRYNRPRIVRLLERKNCRRKENTK